MEIELRDFSALSESEQTYAQFCTQRHLIDEAFREMAIHETSSTDAFVFEMLEAKIEEVKARRPDLSDTDAYIVAGRLLKQLINCYMGALGQLLP